MYLQAMYNEFSTANIQIDKDFSAKLSGYGCVGHIPELEISNNSVVSSFYICLVMVLLYLVDHVYAIFNKNDRDMTSLQLVYNHIIRYLYKNFVDCYFELSVFEFFKKVIFYFGVVK